MSITDAYAAGLVDGEGCVYIQNSTRKGPGRRSYHPVLEIGMSSKGRGLLLLLQREYGGTVNQSRKATERWDSAFAWVATGVTATACLTRLLPHLVLKREQARMAIRVWEIRQSLVPRGGTNARWTDTAAMRCETIRRAVQELNRKGPEEPPMECPTPGAVLYAHRVGGQWVTPQGDLFSDTGWAPLSGSWPASGMAWRGECWTLSTSESPSDAVASSLSDVLETGPHLSKYCLSPKAAEGILRRAERRGRALPSSLRSALEAVAAADRTTTTRPEAA
jgi:hypothetical protein